MLLARNGEEPAEENEVSERGCKLTRPGFASLLVALAGYCRCCTVRLRHPAGNVDLWNMLQLGAHITTCSSSIEHMTKLFNFPGYGRLEVDPV